MPTLIRLKPAKTLADRLLDDSGPFVVVVLLSLLFASAYWSAFAPNPLPGTPTFGVQVSTLAR